ncbi:hypothetical protein TNCV_5134631 [Trichonephila clavipes]|nr:hypothetical protein TNCV_5134631 [Trichonephila clavipes]
MRPELAPTLLNSTPCQRKDFVSSDGLDMQWPFYAASVASGLKPLTRLCRSRVRDHYHYATATAFGQMNNGQSEVNFYFGGIFPSS